MIACYCDSGRQSHCTLKQRSPDVLPEFENIAQTVSLEK